MLELDASPVGPIGCNCVLAWDPATKLGVIVDPGGDFGKIRIAVEARGFKVQALIHTHGHFDHVGATRELQDLWGIPAFLHPDDNVLIDRLDMQTGLFGMPAVLKPRMTPLEAGSKLFGLTVRHTPGHSPGSCILLGESKEGSFVLAGDTLFQNGVGRTDVLGGSHETLVASIRRELYTLPDDTYVIPGHGPSTTIGDEALHNPFVRRA